MEPPMYTFPDAAEFARRHRMGTQLEAAYERHEIETFNKKKSLFNSWVISLLGESKAQRKQYWLFLILPGENGDWKFPKEGDACKVQLYSRSGSQERSKLWVAERIENPCAILGLTGERLDKYAAFQVTVPTDDGSQVLKPLLREGSQTDLNLLPGRATKMRFELSYSNATMIAELGALDRLTTTTENICTQQQRDAFRYLMDFKSPPAFAVNLFDHFPWMAKPRFDEFQVPEKVANLYRQLNDSQ